MLGCFIIRNYNVTFRITPLGYPPLPPFAMPLSFTVLTEREGGGQRILGTRLRRTCKHFVGPINKGVVNALLGELTNRRLLRDAAVRLCDMLTAHAFLSTCQLRAKVDDVGESDITASWKQEDVRLVFKVFSHCFGYFCEII